MSFRGAPGQSGHGKARRHRIREYRLMIYPLVLGAGKRLLAASGPPHPLRMVSRERAGDCLIVIYEPAESS
jgi:hypothetical protein